MKKSFKAGLCAGLLALPLFAGVGSAFATGSSASTDVKLGEIEDITYSVDIIWGDMTFDYAYDEVSGMNHFRPRVTCEPQAGDSTLVGLAFDQGRLYSDADCSTLVEGYGSGDPAYPMPETFYVKEIGGSVIVKDNSGKGILRATATFTPTSAYQWVSGWFRQDCPFIDNGYCTNPNMGTAVNEDFFYYADLNYGVLFLHEDSVQTNIMTVGDTIGTVTVDISQNVLAP